jgi:hypothetical protein
MADGGGGASGILGVLVGAILVVMVGAGIFMFMGKGGAGGGGGTNVTLKVPGTK